MCNGQNRQAIFGHAFPLPSCCKRVSRENPTTRHGLGGNEGRKPLLDMGMVIIQSVVVFFSFWGVVDFKGKILVPLSTYIFYFLIVP